MSSMSERLRQARTDAGYQTGSDAARAFGWPVSTYLGHENGDRKYNIDTATKYAKAFNTSYTWLIDGNAELSYFASRFGQHFMDIPLIGLVRSDGSVDPSISELYGNSNVKIRLPIYTAHELIAIEVAGDYGPRYDVGDILICRPGYDDPFPFIGKYCLIETQEGIWHLGQLKNSPDADKYDLKVVSSTIAEGIKPTQIGSIFLVLPAAQVGPPHGFVERVRTFGDPREPPFTIDPKDGQKKKLRKTR